MTFSINEETPPCADITHALLLYGGKDSLYSSMLSAKYATLHRVNIASSGEKTVHAGEPLDHCNLMTFAAALAGHARIGFGLLPPEVLSVGINHVMWWLPPSRRSVFFTTHDEIIGERSGVTPQPGLVFLTHSRRLWVYAVAGTERPGNDTLLHHAPYLNVWVSGEVCVGNTPLPGASIVSTIHAWEDGFFGSNFSHTNHDKVVKYRGGALRLWKALLDGKHDAFPEKALRKHHIGTLGRLVEVIERGDLPS